MSNSPKILMIVWPDIIAEKSHLQLNMGHGECVTILPLRAGGKPQNMKNTSNLDRIVPFDSVICSKKAAPPSPTW